MGNGIITRRGGGGGGTGLSVWTDTEVWEPIYTGTQKTLSLNDTLKPLWTIPNVLLSQYMCVKFTVSSGAYTVSMSNRSAGTCVVPYITARIEGHGYSLIYDQFWGDYSTTYNRPARTSVGYIYKIGNYLESDSSGSRDSLHTYLVKLMGSEPDAASGNLGSRTVYLAPELTDIELVGSYITPSYASGTDCTVTLSVYGQR